MTITTVCNLYTNTEYENLLNEIELETNLQEGFNVWKTRTKEIYRYISWKQTDNVIVDLVQEYCYGGFNGLRVANMFFYIQGGEIMATNLLNYVMGIPPQFSAITYTIHDLDQKIESYITDLKEYLLISEPPLQICQISGLQCSLDSKEDLSIVVSNYVDINSAIHSHVISNLHPTCQEMQQWNSAYNIVCANSELACLNHIHTNYLSNAYTCINVNNTYLSALDNNKLQFCSSSTVLIQYNDSNKTLKFIRL